MSADDEKPAEVETPALSAEEAAAKAEYVAKMKAEYVRRAGQHFMQRKFFGLDDEE